MSSQLQFCGKVVVVTGAGGGLGRQYALQFAKRGAALVVNDLGGTRDGQGKGSQAADAVVDEIIKSGGKAVADYNSVEHGHKIVETAIDNYGKIDVLINNAGIVRDRSFAKMSAADWDLVQNVHLRGSFMVTKAAWPYLRKQNGKVIFTASAVAMFGNFGQANYSAAKMGLVGLCKTLAIEGAKYNICCNTIIPTAVSRLTEDLLPDEVQSQLDPKFVAPLVMWLSHDTCNENGGVYEAGAGWVGSYEIRRSEGLNCIENNELTPEAISKNWAQITDMKHSQVLDSIHTQVSSIVESANKKPNVLRHFFNFSTDDLILYALSVGCSSSDNSHLKYLYENHDEFSPLPTLGVLPAINIIINDIDKLNQLIAARFPNFEFDVSELVHGEHYLEIFKPLTAANVNHLSSELEFVDMLDKKSGALLILNIETKDQNKDTILFNQITLFAKGSGSFGGNRTSEAIKAYVLPPDRKADCEVLQKIGDNQNVLYRLTGDKNPLHIDPEIAKLGGFQRPLLHGLCSLGHAVLPILTKYAQNDPTIFKRIKARFSNPVYPGETMRIQMWKEGSRIHFEADIVETQRVVIKGGYVDLLDSAGQTSLKSLQIFKNIGEMVESTPGIAADVNACFQWNVSLDGKVVDSWTINLKDAPKVYQGESGAADCTLTCDDGNVVAMATGKLDPATAFMKGQLKIEGNVLLSQKLAKLFQRRSKL